MAKALRLVISFLRVVSTRARKMFSQAYSFSSLMPRSISLVCFSLSLEYSCQESPTQRGVSSAPSLPEEGAESTFSAFRRQCPAPAPTGMPLPCPLTPFHRHRNG